MSYKGLMNTVSSPVWSGTKPQLLNGFCFILHVQNGSCCRHIFKLVLNVNSIYNGDCKLQMCQSTISAIDSNKLRQAVDQEGAPGDLDNFRHAHYFKVADISDGRNLNRENCYFY